MKDSMATVWSLGDAVADLLPEENNRLIKCAGGAPANVSVAVARLGGNAGFIGAVGADPIGRFLRATLTAEQVNTDHMVVRESQRSSVVIVDLDEHGDRSFTFMVRPSADQFLEPGDLPVFANGDFLHLCSISFANEPSRSSACTAMQNARAAGALVSFDPNLRPDVWRSEEDMREQVNAALQLADIIKVSTEELVWLTGCEDFEKALELFWQQCSAKLILVTLGGDGVLYRDQDRLGHMPSIKVDVVDTTGAGDAFMGGLLYGLFARQASHTHWPKLQELDGVIHLACCCGALATTAKGAMTALPSLDAIHSYTQEALS